MTTALKPIYDNRQSFYNKATVIIDDSGKHLYSYNTHVAYIDNDDKPHLLPLWNYSATTLRHVKEFLRQNGFAADSKKQIEQDYIK